MKRPYIAAGCDQQSRVIPTSDIRAHMRWLDAYTWIQLDGTLDFSRPRSRPHGLPIAPAEVDRLRAIAPIAPAPAEAATDIGADDWRPASPWETARFWLALLGCCAVPALILAGVRFGFFN
jgi:hypothetical protein